MDECSQVVILKVVSLEVSAVERQAPVFARAHELIVS